MPKGPDPRADPAPLAQLPRLLAAGASEYNARRFWHAHESWETAWHAVRAAGDRDAAEFLHGMILCAAAFENATRGKEAGFKRQLAEGLFLMRTNIEGATRLGVSGPGAFLDALALLYVDACRRREWATWNTGGWSPPALVLA